jgi:hypothetical protein
LTPPVRQRHRNRERPRVRPGAAQWLTGGHTLNARKMRQGFFSVEPQHILVMSTNHLPIIDDGTGVEFG